MKGVEEVVVCTDEHPCIPPKIEFGWDIWAFIVLAMLSVWVVFRRR